MSVAFKRVYVDLPPDVWEKVGVAARETGISKKAYVAKVLTDATSIAPTKTKRGKR